MRSDEGWCLYNESDTGFVRGREYQIEWIVEIGVSFRGSLISIIDIKEPRECGSRGEYCVSF